jgi:AraC-like DNA-binding protein
MHKSFSTRDVPRNHEFGYWREAIAETYFNLQLSFANDHEFHGQLDQWDLTTASLSRLVSSGLSYRRLRQHCQAQEPQVLVTVPVQSDVEFSQLGRTTRCSPGQFLLELSEEPYEFGHRPANAMLVLKVPVAAIKARVGEPSRFCARTYDRSQGVGQLFSDHLQLVARHCEMAHDSKVMALLSTQLIDLLALSLPQHPDALQSHHSAVRDAHLARVETYVRQHLTDPDLSPQKIAQACSISLRYLHLLFKDTGESVSHWIRERRLQTAHEALSRGDKSTSVAHVAYAAGFSDHAQFTHAFRRKFGHAPSDLLRALRSK